MASTNRCTYCGKEFAKARTLQVHLCEPKRRYLQKDEKWVVNAFMVFQRFYQIHQHNSKLKTYDEFVKSAYYNAFVKFGRFIMHINPLYPEKYIDFVLRSKIKLDHWARDDLYETYLIEALKTEPVESALQRSIPTPLSAWISLRLSMSRASLGPMDIKRSASSVIAAPSL